MESAVKEYFKDELLTISGSATDDYVKELYDKLADNYDEVSSAAGYVGHKSCVELFDRALEKLHGDSRKNLKILDAGAGTGIVGANLKVMGYTYVDAVDISPKMLEKAQARNVYQKLICAPLCEKVISDIATGAYDATICVAAITAGHIKPPALDQMVRHVKPGGIICFTVRRDVFEKEDDFGYQVKMKELESGGKWKLISNEQLDYYSNVDEMRTKCYAIIHEVIKSQ